MSPAQSPGLGQVLRDVLYRIWSWVLDFALVTWVARAPVALLALGFLILGKAPQAQDLLLPLVDSPWWRVALFLVVVFVFWAMPTHYAARLAIDDDERLERLCAQRRGQGRSGWLEFVMCQGPRLLGALTFAALILCASRARSNYPQFPGADASQRETTFTHLDWFMVWGAASFVLFYVYAVIRQHTIAGTRVVGGAERAAAYAARIINVIDVGRTRSAASMRAGYTNSYLGRSVMFIYFWVFVALMAFDPPVVAEWLPGAWIVAVILGGWLPVLAYLSVVGRRLRAPLIIALFGGIALLASFGDNHMVRILPQKDSGDGARIALDHALDAWMQANNCSAATVAACPRPIIVVSAGGASRAGFFSASVIGALLDGAAGKRLDAKTVRNRIFAISGVSGGSLGAVLTVAALASAGKDAKEPCPQGEEVPLWYGPNVMSWRGCLEALMSGDFLTAGFIGLAFHDRIPLRFLWSDRAQLLERSWERYERTIMGDAGKKLPCPIDLECPFLSLRSGQFWLPLLVLNGTSISTGRRVVTTSLTQRYKAKEGCPLDSTDDGCRLFAETYDFYDLLNGRRDSGAVTQDVRLSTAVTNSARFPFVSPPGEIFALSSHKLVDRIGDGGYIENFGVLSAYDLVNAIQAVYRELKPFVLVISNDPNLAVDPQDLPTDASGTNILTDITGFLSGIASTRESRASIGLVNLRTLVKRQEAGCPVSLAHIRVWPSARNEPTSVISMSWWLSKPVQKRLVSEIDPVSRGNRDDLEATWTALSAPHGGCAAQ